MPIYTYGCSNCGIFQVGSMIKKLKKRKKCPTLKCDKHAELLNVGYFVWELKNQTIDEYIEEKNANLHLRMPRTRGV
jgi:hypothetical protein